LTFHHLSIDMTIFNDKYEVITVAIAIII